MTIEEKQEFLVLGALLVFPGKIFTDTEYNNIAAKVVGGSGYVVRESLEAKKYLLVGRHFVDEEIPIWPENYNRLYFGIQVTDIGKKAFHHLKTKKFHQKIKNSVAAATLILVTVGTLYGILTYYKSEPTKPPQPQPLKQSPQPPADSQSQTSKLDATKALSTDTLKKTH